MNDPVAEPAPADVQEAGTLHRVRWGEVLVVGLVCASLTLSRFLDRDDVVWYFAGISAVLWLWNRRLLHTALYLLPLLALRLVGTENWLPETAIGLAMIGLVEWGARAWPAKWGVFSPMLRVILVIAGWWFFSSLWFDTRLPEPSALKPPIDAEGETERQVALALSGGGLRASTFHAGVIREMERRGLRPRLISSVSGGSITASHYASGRHPAEFLALVQQNHLLVKKWIFRLDSFVSLLGPKGRVHAHADLLDRLFLGGMRLKDLRQTARPYLLICTTDIGRGRLVGWSHEGYVTLEVTPEAKYHPVWRDLSTNGGFADLLVSRLVAASGAFPGAFNTLNVAGFDDDDGAGGRAPYVESEYAQFQLADGGLVDNYGLALLLQAIRFTNTDESRQWSGLRDAISECDIIVESDATQVLDAQTTDDPITSFVRSLDIIYSTSQSFNHGTVKSSLRARTGAKHRIGKLVTISPAMLYAPKPVYTPRQLRNLYLMIMADENVHAGALRDQIRETPDHSRRHANGQHGFILNVLQRRAIELKIRRAITGVRLKAARELVRLSGQDPRSLDTHSFLADQAVYEGLAASYTAAQIPRFRSGALSFVYSDLLSCAKAFWTTTTLNDQFSGERADRIYNLGRYLAAIELHRFPVIPSDDS